MDLNDIQILIISLQRSVERRERVRQEMAKTYLSWEFVDGIDGRALDFPIAEYPAKKVKNLLGFELMQGEIGAFLSHKMTWSLCQLHEKVTLVLEDDFVLLPHFEQTLQIILEADRNWDLLRLQALGGSPTTLVKMLDSVSIVTNEIDALGCTAYLLTPRAAKTLLDNSNEIYEPIDHFLEHQKKHGLQFFSVQPYPVTISGVVSTVDNRPDRKSVRGYQKLRRSILRLLDRRFSRNPWFPK